MRAHTQVYIYSPFYFWKQQQLENSLLTNPLLPVNATLYNFDNPLKKLSTSKLKIDQNQVHTHLHLLKHGCYTCHEGEKKEKVSIQPH